MQRKKLYIFSFICLSWNVISFYTLHLFTIFLMAVMGMVSTRTGSWSVFFRTRELIICERKDKVWGRFLSEVTANCSEKTSFLLEMFVHLDWHPSRSTMHFTLLKAIHYTQYNRYNATILFPVWYFLFLLIPICVCIMKRKKIYFKPLINCFLVQNCIIIRDYVEAWLYKETSVFLKHLLQVYVHPTIKSILISTTLHQLFICFEPFYCPSSTLYF